MNIVLPNEVTVYQSLKETVAQLSELNEKYESIWHDKRFTKLFKKN